MTATIDPRIRERRIEVRREAGRKRLRVLLAAVGVFVALGVAYLVVESPMLDVDHVRVAGVQRLDPAVVERAAAVEQGTALLRVDTGSAATRVERLPWVADAKVSRDLPGTLRIVVRERVPVAFVQRAAKSFALLDADGTVIADAPAPPSGTVEVRGVARVPAAGARLAPVNAPGVVRALPAALAARVSVIDLTDNAVTLRLRGRGEVRLCTTDALAAKGAAAAAVLERLGAAPFTYVDVCVPEAPVSK